MIEIVDGKEVLVRFRDENGAYIHIDRLSAEEQTARNQYLRRLRRARAKMVREMREREKSKETEEARDE